MNKAHMIGNNIDNLFLIGFFQLLPFSVSIGKQAVNVYVLKGSYSSYKILTKKSTKDKLLDLLKFDHLKSSGHYSVMFIF